jgi:hypothetical protein
LEPQGDEGVNAADVEGRKIITEYLTKNGRLSKSDRAQFDRIFIQIRKQA